MEPLDSRSDDDAAPFAPPAAPALASTPAPPPPPPLPPQLQAAAARTAPAGATVTTEVATVADGPPVPGSVPAPPASPPPRRALGEVEIRPMAPWRLVGAGALTTCFALIGLQVQRLIDDHPWTDSLMWGAVVAGVLAAVCVLVWTYVATDNARRLVGPAANRPLPDPRAAVLSWLLPFGFVGLSVAVVAYLGTQVDPLADDDVSAIPLAVALLSLLLAIPLTYRPLHHLASAVRQVGGHSSRLAQWMWVPVVLAIVGALSLVGLRIGAVDDAVADDSLAGWAPLWVVAVVAIVPSVIVVMLAWRASGTVEEAITIAAERRRGPTAPAGNNAGGSSGRRAHDAREAKLLPGVDALRVAIVTLVAGLALLSGVGAAVMFMFWMEANESGLTLGQRTRAWDALDALHLASRALAFALIALAMIWTFVAVLNVRRASGRRRNPILAAVAWPAAAFGIWQIADRFVVDQSIGRVVVGLGLQAIVLAVPFQLLERSADAVGARRTPLRITYALGVVLLVHIEGLGGLSTIERTTDISRFGHLAGYLALGALVQLMSTMAVTDACRTLTDATAHEAEHHNMLVAQRLSRNSARPPGEPVAP